MKENIGGAVKPSVFYHGSCPFKISSVCRPPLDSSQPRRVPHADTAAFCCEETQKSIKIRALPLLQCKSHLAKQISIISKCVRVMTQTQKVIKNNETELFLLMLAKCISRKEGTVLFNDALNTFYLRLYGVRHMVKDHSDRERGNPLPPHGLLFPINSKGSFICIIPQTG